MDDANESEALVAYDRWLRSVTPSARTTIGAFFAGRKYATHAALPGAPSVDVQASAVLRRTLGEMGVCISEAMAARGITSWGDGDDLLVGLLDTVRAALAATDRPAAEGER